MDSYCREVGAHLTILTSRFWRGQPEGRPVRDRLYRLAGGSFLDALCIDASAFQDENDACQFLDSLATLRRIPVLLSSFQVSGRSSLVPDSRDGIRQILEHLFTDHGCRRIAFVGGPAGIEDALVRRRAYEEFLAERGIERNPDWVFGGHYDITSGRKAAEALLAQASGLPEAVVFANDEMAVGALPVFRNRGIDVPGQLRVVGFDDSDQASRTTPPLASVSQSLRSKGRLAAQRLFDAVEGLPLVALERTPVTLVPRASCGCPTSTPVPSSRAESPLILLRQIKESLALVLSLGELAQRISDLVPVLQLGGAYLSLPAESEDHVLLSMALDAQGQRVVSPEAPRRFLATQIVPSYLLDQGARRTLVVQSLDKGPAPLGFLVTELQQEDPILHVFLRDHVSEALVQVLSLHEQNRETQILQDRVRDLEAEKSHHEALLQHLPFLWIETNTEGRILSANSRAQAGLDLSPGEPERWIFEVFRLPSDPSHWEPEWLSPLWEPLAGPLVGHPLIGRISRWADRILWAGWESQDLIQAFTVPPPSFWRSYPLSAREVQILTLELHGLQGKEIAASLGISVSTVKGHIGSAYRKMGIGSKQQLVQLVREALGWPTSTSGTGPLVP